MPQAPPQSVVQPSVPPAALPPQPVVSPQPVGPTPTPPPAHKAMSTGAIIALIVGCIVLGAILIALVLAHSGKQNNQDTSANNAAQTSKSATVTTQAGTPAKNSCDLISAAEASAAIGTSVKLDTATDPTNDGSIQKGSDIDTSTCAYSATVNDVESRVQIEGYYPGTVSPVTPNGVKDNYKLLKDTATESDSSVEAVSGLGDEAYWSAGTQTLSALKGDTSFSIEALSSGSPDSAKAAAESLMKTLLSKV